MDWELLSIQNTLKQNEIDDYLIFSHAAWLLSGTSIWTSGHRRENMMNESFVWIDQVEPVVFNQWDADEPQNMVINANIAININTTTGNWRWTAVRNGLTTANYICERRICF